MPLIHPTYLRRYYDSLDVFREFEREWRGPPIVPVAWYGGRETRMIRGEWLRGPFSPVLMRGSIEYMIYRTGSNCANTHVHNIIDRYLRRIKFSSVNEREIYDVWSHLTSVLAKRHSCSYHVHRVRDNSVIYVNGETMYRWEVPATELHMMKSLIRVLRKAA